MSFPFTFFDMCFQCTKPVLRQESFWACQRNDVPLTQCFFRDHRPDDVLLSTLYISMWTVSRAQCVHTSRSCLNPSWREFVCVYCKQQQHFFRQQRSIPIPACLLSALLASSLRGFACLTVSFPACVSGTTDECAVLSLYTVSLCVTRITIRTLHASDMLSCTNPEPLSWAQGP